MNGVNNSDERNDIDLFELFKLLGAHKKLLFRLLLLGFVFGIIIAISIPKTYTTVVTLAPESQSGGVSSNMGALAAMAGINLGGGTSTNEIISPDLFPTLLSSTPFLTELFDISVEDNKQDIDTTLFCYLQSYQKFPWWNSIIHFPSKLLGSLVNDDVEPISTASENTDTISYIVLSKSEQSVLAKLRSLLVVSIDKKMGIVTLSTTMQNPKISALVAAEVTRLLQESIIKYRTSKARQDLEFSELLYNEAQTDYYKKQHELASYTDSNLGVISAKYATTRDRLQNEVNLAYGVYNQMAQQLQMAKIKVQDTTPVYTVIQPPVEPLIPSSPNKKLIIIGFVLLFGLLGVGLVLVRSFILKK